MSTAYSQHIHIVLCETTLHSQLALLFIYAFLFTMWYFFTITAQLTLQQCLQHILNIYIRYCLQLKYPVYWLCCLYMLPLHNVTFFHNYCTIDSTTMSTAYPQHIHTVLFTIKLPSILTLLFIYASFTQCDIFSQLLHNWLYNNVYSISLAYTYSTIYNYTTQYTNCAVYIYFPFHNVNIFPRLLYNCLFHYVYSEASLDTYSTIYNYSPQYTVCAVYICCPFHNVIFFLNYCTIDSTTMSTAYAQHIHTVLLQLHYPVYWLCCLYMLPLHNVTFFHNDCTIHSTTMFTAYSQHIHTVLFTITLPSILTVLFTYAILFTMWYFSTMTAQFTLQQCLQHILNIYIRYCLQLHYPVYCHCYYICYTFHNMIFFHNHCTIDSTTMSIAYPQHIHTVLFTITLPS